MKLIILIPILLTQTLLAKSLPGDHQMKQNLDSVFQHNNLGLIADDFYNNGWIRFKANLNLDPERIFIEHKSLFGLSDNDEMILEKASKDIYGFEHYRYQQTYNGIPIEGKKFIIHAKSGSAVSGNGDLVIGLNLGIAPELHSQFYEKVRENGEEYDLDATGKLIIRKLINGSNRPANFIYNYFFTATSDHNGVQKIYIDPSNCEISFGQRLNRHHNYPDQSGIANTLYNGEQPFKTYVDLNGTCTKYYYLGAYVHNSDYYGEGLIRYTSGSDYHLWCSHRAEDAFRRKHDEDQTANGNTWNVGDNQHVWSAFWSVQKAFQYFYSRWDLYHFGAPSSTYLTINPITSQVPNSTSVFLSGGNMRIDYSTPIAGISNAMVSLDVIGHECTHLAAHNLSGGLSGSGENGAIEEGLCDIFGNVIQDYIEGFSHNDIYTQGEDPISTGTSNNIYKRSLSSPNSSGAHSVNANCDIAVGQPDTYFGNYWDLRDCNGVGIHANSGVMNYWFYLLAEGDTGHNDNNEYYNVDGIGLFFASEIAYIFMSEYFHYGTSYRDARDATIQIAHDLFGACSPQYVQVIKAWNAVGVPAGNSPATYEEKTVSCAELSNAHSLGLPYESAAVSSLEIGCSVGNGYETVLKSGGTITLKHGFSYGTGGMLKLIPLNCD